jgi:hypothetical protein
MPSFLKKSCATYCATMIYGTISKFSSLKKQNKKMGTQPFFENLIKKQMGIQPFFEKSIGGNPDIFGPQHDCGACGGGGCSRCS